MAIKAEVVKGLKAVAHIELMAALTCCGAHDLEVSASVDVPASSGGRELGKVVCGLCGSEWMIGVLARTLEQSRASTEFEKVSDEELATLGVDTTDAHSDQALDPSTDDIAMCVRCDATVGNRRADYCAGCKEFVCARCRTRVPARLSRHAADEHWQEPQFAQVEAPVADIDDDGSRMAGSDDDLDFVAED